MTPPVASARRSRRRVTGQPFARRRHEVLGHHVDPLTVAGACLLLGAAGTVAAVTSAGWWWVVLGVVGPDLAFLAAAGERPLAPGLMPRRAVPFYNAAHRLLPAMLGVALGTALTSPAVVCLSVAWLSHIVWDRGVGYTLRDGDGATTRR